MHHISTKVPRQLYIPEIPLTLPSPELLRLLEQYDLLKYVDRPRRPAKQRTPGLTYIGK